MSSNSGSSLMGLLAGLLDSDSSTNLADRIGELLEFANGEHRWVVSVVVKHNPKRDGE